MSLNINITKEVTVYCCIYYVPDSINVALGILKVFFFNLHNFLSEEVLLGPFYPPIVSD